MPEYIAVVALRTCLKGLPDGHPEREEIEIPPGGDVPAETAERPDAQGRPWLLDQGLVQIKGEPPLISDEQRKALPRLRPVGDDEPYVAGYGPPGSGWPEISDPPIVTDGSIQPFDPGEE